MNIPTLNHSNLRTLYKLLSANSNNIITLEVNINSDPSLNLLIDFLEETSQIVKIKISGFMLYEYNVASIIKLIKTNSNIKSYDFDCLIEDATSQKICTAILEKDIIKKLKFKEGFRVNAQAIGSLIKTSQTLTKLDLKYTIINNQDSEIILDSLKYNQSIKVFGIGGETNISSCINMGALYKALIENNTLSHLDLYEPLATCNKFYIPTILKHNTALTTLNIHSNYIENKWIKELTIALLQNQNLTQISLPSPEQQCLGKVTYWLNLLKYNHYLNEIKFEVFKDMDSDSLKGWNLWDKQEYKAFQELLFSNKEYVANVINTVHKAIDYYNGSKVKFTSNQLYSLLQKDYVFVKAQINAHSEWYVNKENLGNKFDLNSFFISLVSYKVDNYFALKGICKIEPFYILPKEIKFNILCNVELGPLTHYFTDEEAREIIGGTVDTLILDKVYV